MKRAFFPLLEYSFLLLCCVSFLVDLLWPARKPIRVLGIPLGLVLGPATLILFVALHRHVVNIRGQFAKWKAGFGCSSSTACVLTIQNLDERERRFLDTEKPDVGTTSFLSISGVVLAGAFFGVGMWYWMGGCTIERMLYLWFMSFAHFFAYCVWRCYVRSWYLAMSVMKKCSGP